MRNSFVRIIRLYVFLFPPRKHTVFYVFTLTSYSHIRILPRSLWKTYKRDLV